MTRNHALHDARRRATMRFSPGRALAQPRPSPGSAPAQPLPSPRQVPTMVDFLVARHIPS
eukprot:2039978-Lingulodinium_polyedra.AAC.1